METKDRIATEIGSRLLTINHTTSRLARFWDQSVAQTGHTGYDEALLYRYDQPVRLTTVEHIIGKFFPSGLQGKTVLDIGCGTGDFIALSASLGAELIDGIDISPHVLRKAAARFAGIQRIALQCGTVIERVTEQERYDLITSITVLQHHVEDDELVAALMALRSALKPGGRVIVLELAPPHREGVQRQYNRGMCYLVERPPKAWYAAFEAAGLKVVNEPVMPQFGITCLRWTNRLVGLLLSQRQPSANTPTQEAVSEVPINLQPAAPPPQALGRFRRLRRKAFEWLRVITLFSCYPLDQIFGLPLPPARFRTYRIFVLAKGIGVIESGETNK